VPLTSARSQVQVLLCQCRRVAQWSESLADNEAVDGSTPFAPIRIDGPVGKTPAFQAGNPGSNPGRYTVGPEHMRTCGRLLIGR
jgi:hypothetical protein